MKFFCPNNDCEQKLEADPALSGETVSCPTCCRDIRIPDFEETVLSQPTESLESLSLHTEPLTSYFKSKGIASFPNKDLRKGIALETVAGGNPEARYHIGNEIARGGMGAVLLAKDINIRRDVAMKRLLPGVTGEDADQVLRFIEEAQITGQLEHPSIVPVYELGVDSEGLVFYTMKRIEGETLKEILRRIRDGDRAYVQKWPLSRLLRAFLQIADAIAFAHARGVVHRDLKPENVMLGEYGEVLVLDWGIAKVMESSSSPTETENDVAVVNSVRRDDGNLDLFTLAGTIAGSPQYMAPEQAAGEVDRIDHRTDVFALGALLYEVLSLCPPYRGGSVYEVLEQAENARPLDLRKISTSKKTDRLSRQENQPEWPSRPHCPAGRIPAAIAAVTMKAMSKSPDRRYPSAGELREEVDAYLSGFSTSAENADFLREAKLFIRRNKQACATAATAAAVLISVGIASVIVNQRARDEAQNNLASFLEEKEARVQERSVAVPALRETGRDLIQAGKYEEALAITETVLEYRPDDPESLVQKAVILFQLRKWDEAEEAFTRAGEVEDSAFSPDCREMVALLPACRDNPEADWPGTSLATLFTAIGFADIGAIYTEGLKEQIALYNETLRASFDSGLASASTARIRQSETGIMAELSTTGSDISQIRGLAGIPIETMRLNAPVSDLSPLKGSTTLRGISLTENAKVTSISDLVYSPLEDLTINKNVPLQDWAPLAEMTELKTLSIPLRRAEDLRLLESLPLTDLEISWVGEEAADLDITPLSKISTLERLTLTGPSRTFPLSALSELKLEHFKLEATYLPSLDHLPFNSLTSLELRGALLIEELSQLENTNIEKLVLTQTRSLVDLEFLRLMPSLNSLHLEYPYPRASPTILRLPRLPDLETLYLVGGFPFLFPEPEDFPGINSITVRERMHLVSPKMLTAIAMEDWDAAEEELDRMESLCETFGPWETFLPYLRQTRTGVMQFRSGGLGFLSNYILGSASFEGKRYALFGYEKTFRGAEQFAEMLGGRLATVTSEAEQNLLFTEVASRQSEILKNRRMKGGAWIGGTLVPGKGLEWSSGENGSYQKFLESDKISMHPPGSNLTISLGFNSLGYWNWHTPERRHFVLVEWDTDQVEETSFP